MLPLGLILLSAALMVIVAHFFRARRGFPPFALECFVMYVSASALLHWERPVVESPAVAQRSGRQSRLGIAVVIGLAVLLGYCAWPAPARAAGLDLPPAAERGLQLLYSGQPEAALAEFRKIEAAQPDHPLGYLLEAEQRWWQIYCEACEIKWNMVDAWYRPKLPADDAYLALTDKGASLAEARIAQADSAEMRFYAGMAYALRARLFGLREERRATARAGVRAREHFLRALQLDPEMTDAYTGIGLYNYYVDTLSAVAKILRFFMGIPGGDKEEGIRQLQIAAQNGTVTRVGARFYLAKELAHLRSGLYPLDRSHDAPGRRISPKSHLPAGARRYARQAEPQASCRGRLPRCRCCARIGRGVRRAHPADRRTRDRRPVDARQRLARGAQGNSAVSSGHQNCSALFVTAH